MIGRQAVAEQAIGHGGARLMPAAFHLTRLGGGPAMVPHRDVAPLAPEQEDRTYEPLP